MSPNQALLTLHADYIGGQHANYRKWYFAAQLDLDDAVGQTQNPGLQRLASVKRTKSTSHKNLNSALDRWRQAMNSMSQYDRMRQIALWLLCWGEAAQVRFVPECLCFIFKCADDYYRSPECQSRVDAVPEGLYLHSVVKPLYRFIRDQGYEVVDGKFVRRERDHDQIIGYDDVNQLFWYPEGIARIVLYDKVCCVFRSEYSAVRLLVGRLAWWIWRPRKGLCGSVKSTGTGCFSRLTTKSDRSVTCWSILTGYGSFTSRCIGSTQRTTHPPSTMDSTRHLCDGLRPLLEVQLPRLS